MAHCTVEGLDELIADMAQQQNSIDAVLLEMLELGGEVCKSAWQKAAEKHGHIDSGDMCKAVDYDKRTNNTTGKLQTSIYPRGKDKRGIRYAAKAFYRHYGTNRKDATYWVDTAEAMASEESAPKIRERWEQFIREGK